MSKEQRIKGHWEIFVVILIALIIIGFWYYGIGNKNSEKSTNEKSNIANKEAGLYDLVKADGLSFQLTDVYIPKSKSLWWTFTIINEGNSIVNVSDCGVLLFEDGSQVTRQIREYSDGSGYTQTNCNYYILVPGARYSIEYGFELSNLADVPDSKIVFFSQQETGLVKYIIDKSEIRYT